MGEHILVWMLFLNREYSRAEYDQAYKLCKLCFPKDSDLERFKYEVDNPDSFRLYIPVIFFYERLTSDY